MYVPEEYVLECRSRLGSAGGMRQKVFGHQMNQSPRIEHHGVR